MSDAPSRPAPAAGASIWIAAMPPTFLVLWSTGFIGAKFGLPYAEPFTFLGYRFLIVAVLMLFVCLAFRAPWPRDLKLTGHIAVAGLLVQGTYLGGVFAAIHHGMSAGLVALIVGLQPVLTAAIAIPFLKESVSKQQWAGLLLGFGGVFLVVAEKLSGSLGNTSAVWLAVAGLLGITLGAIYQKKFCADIDLRSGSVIQFATSALAIWALAFAFETREVDWTGEFIFALGWLVLVLSIGAISLLMLLIKRGAATKVASLFYLVPPVTALFAFAMFGETLTIAAMIGMGVAVAGVAMVSRG